MTVGKPETADGSRGKGGETVKEQQRDPQKARDQSRDRGPEQRPLIQAHGLRLPAQQWSQILRGAGGDLLELPVPLLEQLARGVGNSSLIDLLRQGGDGDPAACMPDALSWEGPEAEMNHIQTAPPDLFPFPGWPERSGPWLRAAKPDRIRGR